MPRSAAVLSFAFAVGSLLPTAHAAIEWKSKRVELAPALFEHDAQAVFSFTNTGTTPVTIVNMAASCGCTVPALAKQTYAPGESGELTAKYHIGERVGEQLSTITIQTDTPGEGFTRLELAIKIPEPVALDPRVVNWNVDEPPTPKRFHVKFHPGLDWKPTEVATDAAGWKAALIPGTEPGEYWVEVAPPQTGSKSRAVFALITTAPGNKRFALFAFVR